MTTPSISTLSKSPLPQESEVLPPERFQGLPKGLLAKVFTFLKISEQDNLSYTCRDLNTASKLPYVYISKIREIVKIQDESEAAKVCSISQELITLNKGNPGAFPIAHTFNPALNATSEEISTFSKHTLEIKYKENPDEMFAYLQKHTSQERTSITSLDFNNTEITDDHLDRILDLCPSVVELDLSNSPIKGSGLRKISHQVQELWLGFCEHLNEQFLIELLPSLTQLEALDLTKTAITKNIFQHISNTITALNLRHCSFDISDENELGQLLLRLTQLEYLNLSGTDITGDCLEPLLEIEEDLPPGEELLTLEVILESCPNLNDKISDKLSEEEILHIKLS